MSEEKVETIYTREKCEIYELLSDLSDALEYLHNHPNTLFNEQHLVEETREFIRKNK